jgi:hypothetical protein
MRAPYPVRMQPMRNFCKTGCGRDHTLTSMTKLDAKTRTLTIELPESEWQALRNVEPDAIGWLQERIRERLGSQSESTHRFEPASKPMSSMTDSYFGGDEY